jgi:hypothetical protein
MLSVGLGSFIESVRNARPSRDRDGNGPKQSVLWYVKFDRFNWEPDMTAILILDHEQGDGSHEDYDDQDYDDRDGDGTRRIL